MVIFVLSLILGLAFSDYNEFSIIFSDLEYVFGYFVKLVGFFSFCMFLGILVKRSAFALGFLFIWYVAENIIYALLKFKLFKNTNVAEQVTQFFPLESMSNLIIEPFSRLNIIQSAANQLGSEFQRDYVVHWYEILIVLTWTSLFVTMSYFLLKKRDL